LHERQPKVGIKDEEIVRLERVQESGLEASIDRSLGRQSPVSVCTLVEGKPKRIDSCTATEQLVKGRMSPTAS